MSIGRSIKKWVTDHGRESASKMFQDAYAKHEDFRARFSLRDLATGLLGDDWYNKLQRTGFGGYRDPNGTFHGYEGGDAVDSSTFADITGNRLIDTVREGYNSPEFIASKIAKTIPVTNGNLDTIREPWLSSIMPPLGYGTAGTELDRDEHIVNQGMPYPRRDFLPNYVVLQRPVKTGEICDVTFEMIYADRTKQAIDRAHSVGRYLALIKEYEILRCLLGLNVDFTFKYAGMTSEYTSPTYVETAVSGNRRWSNDIHSLTLSSWEDVNVVLQKFSEMRDPSTGTPIDVQPTQIFVMPKKYLTAMNVLHATQVRIGDGASVTTATYAKNPLSGMTYDVLTSPHAYKIASTGSTLLWPEQDSIPGTLNTTTVTASQAYDLWFMMKGNGAFYWREVEPMRTWQAPPMNPDEFNRDVVLSVKARQFGVAGTYDPFKVVRCWGHDFSTVTT